MTMAGQSTTIGVFRDRTLAEQAISELKRAGFTDDQISLVSHNTGGALGGLRGLFGRHAEQEQLTNDANQQQAVDLPQELAGVPTEQAPFYQRELNAGNSIVAVRGGGQQARDILYRHGAYDAGGATNTGATGTGRDIGEAEETRTVPIREERLDINKQTVQVGEIRIHKRIITENKTFTVPVRREEVYIERIPARGEDAALNNALNAQGVEFNQGLASLGTAAQSTPAYIDPTNTATAEPFETQSTLNPLARLTQRHDANTTRETQNVQGRPGTSAARDAQDTIAQGQPLDGEMLYDGGMIRIFVREERVSINKQPVVIEEIRIRKQPIEQTQTINETLRHEVANVEQAGNIVVHGGDTAGVTSAGNVGNANYANDVPPPNAPSL